MKFESMFTSLNISASGLSAQRKKLDAISSNIANVNTTRTESGEPYRKKVVVMKNAEIPSFEKFLHQTRLSLQITNPEHIAFKQIVSNRNTTGDGVEADIQADKADFRKVYDPQHPDADEEGYVYYPNINIVSEMVEMITASRAYEANLSSIESAKRIAKESLNI